MVKNLILVEIKFKIEKQAQMFALQQMLKFVFNFFL